MSLGPRPSSKDVIAGVGVALILIPQSMAYAELAGLPARHGLFAAALGPLAAAFFASSPYLQTGPVALTALLTLGALVPVAVPGSAEYVGFAALLALVVGIVRVLVGALKGGWISYVMSRPMLDGFMSGAAILQALLRSWPTDRLSVADRGLREGLLYAQMSADGVLEDGPF